MAPWQIILSSFPSIFDIIPLRLKEGDWLSVKSLPRIDCFNIFHLNICSFTSVPLYEPSLYLKCSDGTEWEHHERRTNHTYEFPCPNSTLADVSVCQWTDSEFITVIRSNRTNALFWFILIIISGHTPKVAGIDLNSCGKQQHAIARHASHDYRCMGCMCLH